MPRATVAKALQETSFYGAVAFFFILAAFPFYWMVITSFKTNSDLYNVTNIPFWFNDRRPSSTSAICSRKPCSRPGC